MKKMIVSRQNRLLYQVGLMLILGLLLSACGTNIGASPTPIPLPAVGTSSDSSSADSDSNEMDSDEVKSSDADNDNNREATTSATDAVAEETDVVESGVPALAPTATPESAEEAAQTVSNGVGLDPVQLDIEQIRLSASITPMEWRIVRIDGQRTTEWIIPDATAGWHPDSAGVGEAGNVLISGYQNAGDAVFSQLALGNVQVGMEIIMTAADGSTQTYVVSEVGTPIPLDGASAAETDQVVKYYAPSDEAKLTLITGWPAFTTTHRLFVIATLVK